MRRRGFEPNKFVETQVNKIREILGNKKAIVACSGGVDSTVCAVLTYRAIGDNLLCVSIDTNFMRFGEPERVCRSLGSPPLSLPVKLVKAKDLFMSALNGLEDAEEKRKAFRATFYSILSKIAEQEGCEFLVQGTILPDVLETVAGIKTQHNVLEQLNIDTKAEFGFKVIEPLISLYKFQVREVAKVLSIPDSICERQPFPGPGLSVRVVGQISPEKLEVEKNATEIVESLLEPLQPKQYFAATFDASTIAYPGESRIREELCKAIKNAELDIKSLRTKATGICNGKRLYGTVILLSARDSKSKCLEIPYRTLNSIQHAITSYDPEVARVLYCISDKPREGLWLVAIRAVDTRDFVKASVSKVPWDVLKEIEEKVTSSCPTVGSVFFDVTPKPPGSIEFE
ncbi:MAG: GMP synthase [Candidatus Bathyarchaeia archaeon]